MAGLVDKYEDIDMLEIPNDEDFSVTSSSDTEGISDSTSSSKNKANNKLYDLFNSQSDYISLQEWLKTDKVPEFNFDTLEYQKSVALSGKDDTTKSYVQYINSLYKVIEGLTDQNVTRIELEQSQDEPIGIITDSSFNGSNLGNNSAKADFIINQAFENITQHLSTLLNSLSNTEAEEVSSISIEQLQNLSIILECLRSNWFYGQSNQRPELLVRWINTYDYKPSEDLITSVMIETEYPFLHPYFWITLLSQLLTRGLFEQAAEVINGSKFQEHLKQDGQSSESSEELFEIIFDFYELVSTYTSFALKGQFDKWKLKACEFRDVLSKRKSKISTPSYQKIARQIFDLACIITGLPKTISNYCEEWYELYVALALFQVRDDKELYSDYYRIAKEEKPSLAHINSNHGDHEEVQTEQEDDTKIETCFINIIEENFLKVLQYLHELDPFTSGCISKLLELKGLFKNYYSITPGVAFNFQNIIDKKTISEYFLTIQAYECLNVHDLVPVGIGLLMNEDITTSKSSSGSARRAISSFLPKYHCKTNDDLEWILTICAKLNLLNVSRELYYVYGLKSLDEGLLFEALNMFVKSYDPDSLDDHKDGLKQIHYIIWDMIFQDSLVNNRPTDDELINNFVSGNIDDSFEVSPVIRQCLSPYAVLYKFFKSLDRDDAENAIDVDLDSKKGSLTSLKSGTTTMSQLSSLIHLLRFNHLPKKFYPLLLSQILPFLTKFEEKFQLPDLIMLIELIDNYELQSSSDEVKEGEALYKYSINHLEDSLKTYDWRLQVKYNGITIPESIQELIKVLRNQIVAKVGQVYIK